jgi:excisionase family DNA binding protein
VSANNGREPLALYLPDELVDAVVDRVLEATAAREPVEDRWLDVAGAAEHLSCPPSRIYSLTSAGRIPHEKDGSRLLFRVSELDAWVRSGGARRP